jgi:hypothetical protein
LIKDEFVETPIPLKEFRDFISYAEEWKPEYWPSAPKGYVGLILGLPKSEVEDLSTLPLATLPLDVRIAFQGWENYFKAGEAVNTIQVTKQQLESFLDGHPHYARNYWQNIVKDTVPNYLKSEETGTKLSGDVVPSGEFASFLKVALYNYLQGKQDKQEGAQDKTQTKLQDK